MRSVFRPNLFKGKVALVTGGGTGIGKAVASELVGLGAKVVIAARNTDRLQDAAVQLNTVAKAADAPDVSTVQLNIRDSDMVGKVLEDLVAAHGRIDFLVNNGGGQFASPAAAISPKGWRAVVDTNLNGTWNMCQGLYHATPALKRPGVAIVNVTADFFNGFPGMAHTGAARAGVDNMTKTLSREWGPEGIRVNSVAPGIILSSGVHNYPKETVGSFFESGESVAAGRCGSESEVASAIVFLLSPGAAYMTGTTVRVDGGGSLGKTDFVTGPFLREFREMDGTPSEERAKAVREGAGPYHATQALADDFEERQKLKSEAVRNSKL